jgi:hypothetical protein|tara:strand:+ start:418 stop:762 length:345 start_codon:yes stop_codon:yes gene_type:complete
MQRNTEVSPREEIDLGEINKGVELLMRREFHPPTENLTRRKRMEAALITIGVFTGILTLSVGVILGYILRTYIQEDNRQAYTYHPEMFDENGNLVPDEILSVRFEDDESTELED